MSNTRDQQGKSSTSQSSSSSSSSSSSPSSSSSSSSRQPPRLIDDPLYLFNKHTELKQLMDKRKQLKAEFDELKNTDRHGYDRQRRQTFRDTYQLKQDELLQLEAEIKSLCIEINELRSLDPESLAHFTDIGMTMPHTVDLGKFASANEMICIWRPINQLAANKLSEIRNNKYMGKGINSKGKSSEFGPIAGCIPANARLSKLATTNPQRIATYQHKIDDELKQAQQRLTEIRTSLHRQDLQLINNEMLVVSVHEKDSKQREMYFIEEGIDKEPLFVVKANDNRYFIYNTETKEFNGPILTDLEGKSIHPVFLEYYVQFDYDQNHKLIETLHPLTADYDELVSAPRKIFPILNNKNLRTTLSTANFTDAANGRLTMRDLWVQAILHYELREKENHRDTRIELSYGAVNDWQQAAKIVMKGITGNATNHGPEVNNPFPEPFSDEAYGAHLEDSTQITLNGEQEVCNFINAKRKVGFPLDVNPKWGWQINANGDLYLPAERYNWSVLENRITNAKSQLDAVSAERKKLISSLNIQDSDKNIDVIRNLTGEQDLVNFGQLTRLNDQLELNNNDVISKRNEILSYENERLRLQNKFLLLKQIYNLQLEITKLRLEPDIIYSEDASSPSIAIALLEEDEKSKELREYVAYEVRRQERIIRDNDIKHKLKTLKESSTKFIEDYGEPLSVEPFTQTISFPKKPSSKTSNQGMFSVTTPKKRSIKASQNNGIISAPSNKKRKS